MARIGIFGVGLALSLSLSLGVEAAGDVRLIEAVRAEDRNAIRTLLAQRADVNATQGDGSTALHWAAHRDDLESVTALLRAGARVDAPNDLGVTPLALACANGNAPIVKALLDARANPSAIATGEPVLTTAARSGNRAAVEALLVAGATVDARDTARGQTALMTAVAHGHPEVVRVLIEHGADVEARSAVSRQWVMRGNRYGGVISRERAVGERAVGEAPHGGSTPLLFAARSGDVGSARLLLAAGANANDTAADGTSALVMASHSGHGPLAALLLDGGAQVNAADAGYTALHAAVLRGDLSLVTTLLARGANVNAPVTKGTPSRRYSKDLALNEAWVGSSAFWLAARFGEIQIARTLVEGGADPRVIARDGTTAAMAAIDAGVDFGPSASDQRDRRLDPLELSAKVARHDEYDAHTADMVDLVLDLGVNVNAADRSGDTALHLAVAKGFVKVVQTLADHGADLSPRNKRGQTPLATTTGSRRDEGAPSMQGVIDLLGRLGVKP